MSDASAPWGLVTYRRRGEMADRAGARLGDGTIVQVPELVPYPGLLAALDDWDSVVAALAAPEPPTGEPEPDAVVMTPVRYPRKLLGVGANYASHVEEMHVTPAPPADHPFFFSVPPTTCVIGPDDAVVMPDDPAAKVDWEVELAVVIGRRIRQADATAARAAVAGWTVANDISARGYMWKNDAPPPFNLDWLQHKGRDTFFPIGPVMVPSWALPDPHNLRLRLVRNGTVEQK